MEMTRRISLVLFIAVLTIAALCSGAGAEETLRIVSLNPSATEIITSLGAGDWLCGVTQFCPFPEILTDNTNIGTILDPDVEKIVSLGPDIVFATREGNRESSMNALRAAGVDVFVLDEIKSFNDIYDRISVIGELLGKEKNARSLVSKMKRRIGRVKRKIGDKEPLNVFLQLGAEPIVTVNKDTIMNEMVEIAGGQNIAKDVPMRYPKYSREDVVMKDPDAIIIVAMGAFGVKALKKWKAYEPMKAAKKNMICIIDSNIVCHMGPRLVEGVEEMAVFLHPEIFEGDKSE